jgi:uncharacterized ubiquitin-like protein YukD
VPKITECIFTLDVIKFLVQIAWEAKSISHKQYEEMATKLNESGKILGGWKKKMSAQGGSAEGGEEKKNRTL